MYQDIPSVKGWRADQILDAAYSILHAAGRPLRFEEITGAALGHDPNQFTMRRVAPGD